jgi:chromosome segregation ATPase
MKAILTGIIFLSFTLAFAQNDNCAELKKQLHQYRQKNDELDKIITAKQAEIEKIRSTIEGLVKRGTETQTFLIEVKSKISEYEEAIRDLQKKVDEITLSNKKLAGENEILKDENEKLRKGN